MAIFKLFAWLKYFRKKRRMENLSQIDLFKQELTLLIAALVTIAIIVAVVVALIEISLK